MTIDLYEIISNNPALLAFLTIGLGYLLGRVKLGSVDLGSATGVLLVGLWMGHQGFSAPALSGQIGFTLFIFCVGLQAGPQFFSAFAEDGRGSDCGAWGKGSAVISSSTSASGIRWASRISSSIS